MRRYRSEDNLGLIKAAFRNPKGGIFGGVKPYIAYLLLSSCHFPDVDIARCLQLKSAYSDFFALPGVKAALCNCEERLKMSDLLGWRSPKCFDAIDICAAAAIWGPAVAYCVPEKMIMHRFLADRKLSVNHYTGKIQLQDLVFETLQRFALEDPAPRMAEGDLFQLKVVHQTYGEFQLQAPSYVLFHDIVTRLFVEAFGLDVNQPYRCLLPDYRSVFSPPSYARASCAHRISGDAITMAECNIYLDASLILFLDSPVLPPAYLTLISLESQLPVSVLKMVGPVSNNTPSR